MPASAQSGLWDIGSTWVGGNPPAPGEDATIKQGHTVTLRTSVAIEVEEMVGLAVEAGAYLVIVSGGGLLIDGSTEVVHKGVIRLEGSAWIKWAGSTRCHGGNTGTVVIASAQARVYYANDGFHYVAKCARAHHLMMEA